MQQGSLHNHVNLHKKIRPFKCDVCEKPYAQRRCLQVNILFVCILVNCVFEKEILYSFASQNHKKNAFGTCDEPNRCNTFTKVS